MTAPDRVAAVVRRLLPAPPSLVYDTWLDADALAEFITPQPARSGRIEWTPRVGAPFRIDMVDAQGTVQITGEILELERPSLLRFTWRSSLGGGFDSVVTVMLAPSGEADTLMTIEHIRLPAEFRVDHEAGWTRIAEQLDDRLRRVG